MSDAAWDAIKDYEYEQHINKQKLMHSPFNNIHNVHEEAKAGTVKKFKRQPLDGMLIPDELFPLLNDLLYEAYLAFDGYKNLGGDYDLTYQMHYQFIKTAIESYYCGKDDKDKSKITAAYERGYQDGHEAARQAWGDNSE